MTAIFRPAKKTDQNLVRKNRRRLRRSDGEVYLERWGFESQRFGGIFIHRFTSPDPGTDLHDHPWFFASFVLWGGYDEERAPSSHASAWVKQAERMDLIFAVPAGTHTRGDTVVRRWLSWRSLRLNEAHRITRLHRPAVWTLVVRGPYRKTWGFYTADGWLDEQSYAHTVHGSERDLHDDIRGEKAT